MPRSLPYILIIEDGDEDYDMLAAALASCGVRHPARRACDAAEALALLQGLTPPTLAATGAALASAPEFAKPCFIFLDLNLPDIDGRTLLQRIKQMDAAKTIPVMVLTTSDSPRDVLFCYEQGAACYAVKPVGLGALEALVASFQQFWLERVVLPL